MTASAEPQQPYSVAGVRFTALTGSRIMVVESPDHRSAYEGLRRANRLGAHLTLVSTDPAMYPATRKIRWNPLSIFDACIQADTTSVEAVLSALPAGGSHWDACLTFSDYHTEVATRVARLLGLPGPDPAIVEMMKQKHILRARLAGTAFDVPHALIKNENQLADAVERLGFPLIAKPTAAGGGVGVRFVTDMRELRHAYQEISAIHSTSRGNFLAGHVLLEYYLDGPVYSVETLTWKRRTHVYGITGREFHPNFPFTENGFAFPVLEQTAEGAAAKSFVTELLDLIGFSDSAAHTEIKLTPEGPRLIESNPRLAGALVPTLIQIVCDSDPYLDAMLVAMGVSPAPGRPRNHRGAALVPLTADDDGSLKSVHGLAEAQAMPGVQYVDLYYGAGDAVHLPRDARRYLGWLCVTSDDARRALRNADETRQRIVFEVARNA